MHCSRRTGWQISHAVCWRRAGTSGWAGYSLGATPTNASCLPARHLTCLPARVPPRLPACLPVYRGPLDFFWELPPVTRLLMTTYLITGFGVLFGLVPLKYFYHDWGLIWRWPPQVPAEPVAGCTALRCCCGGGGGGMEKRCCGGWAGCVMLAAAPSRTPGSMLWVL